MAMAMVVRGDWVVRAVEVWKCGSVEVWKCGKWGRLGGDGDEGFWVDPVT